MIDNLDAKKYDNITRELNSISQAIKASESQSGTNSYTLPRDDINTINQKYKSLELTINLKEWASAKKEANDLLEQVETHLLRES